MVSTSSVSSGTGMDVFHLEQGSSGVLLPGQFSGQVLDPGACCGLSCWLPGIILLLVLPLLHPLELEVLVLQLSLALEVPAHLAPSLARDSQLQLVEAIPVRPLVRVPLPPPRPLSVLLSW